jgi:serine/threonine-protein kinase
VPAPLDALVGRMLAKAREARPSGGAEVIGLLRALQTEEADRDARLAAGLGGAGEPERRGVDSWGYLGDALTAAGSMGTPPTAHKLIWLIVVAGAGRGADGPPGLPERALDVVAAFHGSAQRLLDGSLLVRIEHERGVMTPSAQDVGSLAPAQPEDADPAQESRRRALLLGMLRRARIQAQGGARAARCALGVRGAMHSSATALTIVPPARPGEWLSGQAIDLAVRLLDRGIRAGLQGIVMDEESADLLDVELFSLIAAAGLVELRGEWTAQRQEA